MNDTNNQIKWIVPEFEKHERSKGWYIYAIIIAALMLVYAFWTSNFLFAVIIIISAVIIILHDGQEPEKINISITDEGINVGNKFHDYDDLRNFSIIYKPRTGVKNLYIEFKNVIKPRISISLDSVNPLLIREKLLKYVPEDLDRTEAPVSEGLGKKFKI